MRTRVIVAAVLVAAALGIGVVRSVSSHDTGTPPPAVTASGGSGGATTGAGGPTTGAGGPSNLPVPPTGGDRSGSAAPEPVDEGAGPGDVEIGAGRDAGADGDGADRRRWEPVATGFARAFSDVDDRDTTATWRGRLRPYITMAVDQQLAGVDVRNVPRGRFDGLDVLESSDESVTAQITYSPGWALVLHLVSDGNDHWKVYRYDRLDQ